MTVQVTKLTVSIPRELVDFADKVAKERKISRSKVVASCLQEMAKQKLQADLEDGYRAMAKSGKPLADVTFEAQREVVPEG
jgi:metal-responsive CopG/Arc/MetJ family transcriptional regulator